MQHEASDEAPVLRLVDAPDGFRRRVHAAIPGASLIYADRPTKPHTRPVTRQASGLAIVYERGVIDRSLIAEMSAHMPTLVVTEHPTTDDALACLDSGADGYLDAALDAEALRSALLGAAAGELAYARDVVGLWLRTRLRKATPSGARLTTRQRELLEYIARGSTDKEIAASLGVPKSTVQKQVSRLLRTIGARNRAAAVAVRERLGA